MARNLPSSLPPLDSSLREHLMWLGEHLGFSDLTVSELAWVAFHRNWDAAMLDTWAKAKKALGDRVVVPAGPAAPPNVIDPRSQWAMVELGTRHGVLPGQVVTNEDGTVVEAWLDGRAVSPGTFRTATESLLRAQAKAFPNGKLAKELAGLERARRRLRGVRALCVPIRRSCDRVSRTDGRRHRRSPRRAARRHALRKARVRSGDPPEPPPAPRAASAPPSRWFRSVSRNRSCGASSCDARLTDRVRSPSTDTRDRNATQVCCRAAIGRGAP